MALPLYRLLVSAFAALALWLGAPRAAFAEEAPAVAGDEQAAPPAAAPSGTGDGSDEATAAGVGAADTAPAGTGSAEATALAGGGSAEATEPAGGGSAEATALAGGGSAEATAPSDGRFVPSLTAEQLRALSSAAREKVLERLQAKMEASTGARMERISELISWFSLAGFLLLLMPLFLMGRHPGRFGRLLKYSIIAAFTFVITVNLFGVVMLVFRAVQSALGEFTNPQLSIVAGFFDSIENNAEDFLMMGKELFAPTLAQLNSDSDQPAVILIANGAKLVKDAHVFVAIANVFKKLDFVLAALPIVLLLVTMVLFLLALRPTLVEIVRLPLTAAGGQAGAGRTVLKRTFRRVLGELVATLCTLGVLIVLTMLSSAILGGVVDPALDALLNYLQLGILYLQFVESASSGAVFVMLFSVILFLVLNVVVVIASMTLYLGKAQKIFQRKFTDRVPLRAHRRFWGWGTGGLVVAQLIPLGYLTVAEFALDKLNDSLTGGGNDAAQLPWTAIMLTGPLLLVIGFLVAFWAARGVKALAFLATYKVPPVPSQSGPR